MSELSLDAEVEVEPRGDVSGPHWLVSGARPALWFGETGPGGEPELHSVLLRLVDRNRLRAGERGEARIVPLAFETWPDVKPGMRFDIYDGTRRTGAGRLTTTPATSGAHGDLRKGLADAFEEWVVERFGDRVAHRERLEGRLAPDFVVWFDDDSGARQSLVGEVIARRPTRKDVERLARMIKHRGAALGILLALDDPNAATLDAIYDHGLVALPGGLRAPRIRVVTAREIAHDAIDLLPSKRQPRALELHAA